MNIITQEAKKKQAVVKFAKEKRKNCSEPAVRSKPVERKKMVQQI